jgi:hypothetical protein
MLRATGLALFLGEGGTIEQAMAMTGISNPSRMNRHAGGPAAGRKPSHSGAKVPPATI